MVYKTGLLIILSAFLLNAQIMLNPKRSDILNPSIPTAGAYIPDIVYQDSAKSNSAGTNADSIVFTHWGSIQANQLIVLVIFAETTLPGNWTSGDDVSEAGWTFGAEAHHTQPDIGLAIFYKVATGSESGSFQVNSVRAGENSGFYLVFDSAYTASPIDGYSDTTAVNGALNEDEITLEADVTTNNFCISVGAVVVKHSQYVYNMDTVQVSGTGWSLYETISNRPGNSYAPSGYLMLKDNPTAGSTGTVNLKHGYNSQDGSVGIIVSIRGNN